MPDRIQHPGTRLPAHVLRAFFGGGRRQRGSIDSDSRGCGRISELVGILSHAQRFVVCTPSLMTAFTNKRCGTMAACGLLLTPSLRRDLWEAQ
jgi:hypothetical protein